MRRCHDGSRGRLRRLVPAALDDQAHGQAGSGDQDTAGQHGRHPDPATTPRQIDGAGPKGAGVELAGQRHLGRVDQGHPLPGRDAGAAVLGTGRRERRLGLPVGQAFQRHQDVGGAGDRMGVPQRGRQPQFLGAAADREQPQPPHTGPQHHGQEAGPAASRRPQHLAQDGQTQLRIGRVGFDTAAAEAETAIATKTATAGPYAAGDAGSTAAPSGPEDPAPRCGAACSARSRARSGLDDAVRPRRATPDRPGAPGRG